MNAAANLQVLTLEGFIFVTRFGNLFGIFRRIGGTISASGMESWPGDAGRGCSCSVYCGCGNIQTFEVPMNGSHARRKGRSVLAVDFSRQVIPIELLESRQLLSASAIVVQPNLSVVADAASGTVSGYSPAQIRHAYGFDQLTGDGLGQTIAIVDAYNDPNIAADLKIFDKQFGLSNPDLKVVNQSGGTTLPRTNADWAGEIALDVEWAHAMAPQADIVLVEANSASLSDLMKSVNTARNLSEVSVVSMSWGAQEFFGETQYDSYFTTPSGHQNVTFLAASGDDGGIAEWPAVSTNVLSVGGTRLSTSDSSGTYAGESAWSGSGGGTSRYESVPSYQSGITVTSTTTTDGFGGLFGGFAFGRGRRGGGGTTQTTTSALTSRSAPDVSYNADPSSGFAVYDSFEGGWSVIGGTSAGAPQWAALVAIADQGRVASGLGTLSSAQTLQALYSVYGAGSSADASTYAATFDDITSGSRATNGYDRVTGLGSPKAGAVVDALGGDMAAKAAAGAVSGASQTSGAAAARKHFLKQNITTPDAGNSSSADVSAVYHSTLAAWWTARLVGTLNAAGAIGSLGEGNGGAPGTDALVARAGTIATLWSDVRLFTSGPSAMSSLSHGLGGELPAASTPVTIFATVDQALDSNIASTVAGYFKTLAAAASMPTSAGDWTSLPQLTIPPGALLELGTIPAVSNVVADDGFWKAMAATSFIVTAIGLAYSQIERQRGEIRVQSRFMIEPFKHDRLE